MIDNTLFKLSHQPDLKSLAIKDRYGNSPLREIAALQQQFFQSLFRDSLTLSLRYLYDRHAPQQLQIFLLFHTPEELKPRLTSALQTSEFQQIYSFQEIKDHQQLQALQNLDWVEAIVEITKAETISDKGYYLPHPFTPNPDHSMVELCEQFARIGNFSPEKFLLEITLQPYPNPTQTAQWKNALDTLLAAHTKASSTPDATLETVIKGIRDYQTRYSHAPLFTYSLKLMAESDRHLATLSTLWLQNATSSEYTNLHQPFPIIKRGDVAFQTSLESTQNLQISPDNFSISPHLQDWQQQFGDKNISQIFGAKSYLWSEGITQRPRTYTPPPQPPSQKTPQLPSQPQASSSSSITTNTGSHALAKLSNSPAPTPKMQDILPLRHLTTLEEISSFLRVVIPTPHPVPGMAIAQPTYPTMTAEEIFNKYKHLITPDTYIVGLDDNGRVITSSWEDIPHRLIAGQTRFGKTNFIQWLLFQFFYKSPQAKTYIMDFKGIDFPDLKSFLPNFNIEVVTEVEEALDMVEMIDVESEERKQLMKDNPGARKITDLQNKGILISRMLWIIDEASDIADNYSLADEIEKRLKKYARKGASFGIHMIYAAQNPDSSVISKQVTEQLGEKTIFKVSYGASMNVLEIGDAEHITKKGRAILHRGVNDWFYVNTPLMPNLSEKPFETTIWAEIFQDKL